MTKWFFSFAILLSTAACIPQESSNTASDAQIGQNAPTQSLPTQPPPSQIEPTPVQPTPARENVPNDPNWQNWPLVDGAWQRSGAAGSSFALYNNRKNQQVFGIKCSKDAGKVTILRRIDGKQASAMTIATSFGRQNVRGRSITTANGMFLEADLNPNDRLLDQFIFSRGSIGVVVDNRAAIRIPTSPKFARIVEDCR